MYTRIISYNNFENDKMMFTSNNNQIDYPGVIARIMQYNFVRSFMNFIGFEH